jgi:hypothetical protein
MSTVKLLLNSFATTRSSLPSPLKSAAASEEGRDPTGISGCLVNLPASEFSSTEMLLLPWLAIAKSAKPSLLKSPLAIELGELPTVISGCLVKLLP